MALEPAATRHFLLGHRGIELAPGGRGLAMLDPFARRGMEDRRVERVAFHLPGLQAGKVDLDH